MNWDELEKDGKGLNPCKYGLFVGPLPSRKLAYPFKIDHPKKERMFSLRPFFMGRLLVFFFGVYVKLFT